MMHMKTLFKSSRDCTSLNVVIIGGNRGLGLGLTRKYLSLGHNVCATYRNKGRAQDLEALHERYAQRFKTDELEITNDKAIERFKEKLDMPIDILILNAGILLCPPGSEPLTETMDEMKRTFEVNTFAPDQIMRVLFPKLLNPHSCAVYISSTLGSMQDNIKGRYQTYRASKAAGNIIFQNWNIELAKKWLEKDGNLDERPTAFPISPGVVRTDMGGPNSPLSVEESVNGMIQVIEEVRLTKESAFYLYNGDVLQQFPTPEVVKSSKQNPVMLLSEDILNVK